MLHVMSRHGIGSDDVPLRSASDPTTRMHGIPLGDRDLDRAYRIAGLILGNHHDAEDATQEALLRAWRSLASIRNQLDSKAWFDRILINVCRDRLRTRRRVRFVDPEVALSIPQPQDEFRAVLDRDQILRAIQSLDDDSRVVVVLHYWADLTLEAISKRTGWRVGTVKSRLHRALSLLRTEIGDLETSEGGP